MGIHSGLTIDSEKIASLVLDHARLSQSSFDVIVGKTGSIVDVSLVGLTFSDGLPGDLGALLSIPTLDNVRIDLYLFGQYAQELNAFDAMPGNTVTVVPEPNSSVLILLTCWLVSFRCSRRLP